MITHTWGTPDVSEITPDQVDVKFGRSENVWIVYINPYGRYQRVVGYWHDVDKCFYTSGGGERLTGEIVRLEEL